MVDETYITIKPKRDKVSEYIAYYYFNTSEEKNYTKEYIFYPHFRNAITVYKHSKISFSDNRSTVTPNQKKALEIIYTGIHSQSRIGKIHAPFDKIGIVFHPLGINNFISEPLSTIVTEDPKPDFDYFGNELNKTLEQVYALSNPKDKVYELDRFFEARIQPFKDQRLLKAIDLMFDRQLGVSEISETLNISRKTLQRLFKKHLNCAPKEFSNLIKFRKAIDIYQKQKPALTDLAYQNDYYDQSDFIKHFKKVTGFNPKQFFGSLSHLGSEDTFWTVLNSK